MRKEGGEEGGRRAKKMLSSRDGAEIAKMGVENWHNWTP